MCGSLKFMVAAVVLLGVLQFYVAGKEASFYATSNMGAGVAVPERSASHRTSAPAKPRTFHVRRVGKNSWMEWEVTDAKQ